MTAAYDPVGPSFTRPIASVFVVSASYWAYTLIFQMTKPSPFQGASSSELITAVGLTCVGVGAIGIGIGIPLALVERALRHQHGSGLPTLVIVSVMSFVALLTAIDNFIYTAARSGLRGDQSPTYSIALIVVCIWLGWTVSKKLSRTSRANANRITILGASVGILGIVLAAPGIKSASSPNSLVERGTATKENILILSSDGVDATHMGVYGYDRDTTPFLDSIKDELAFFENGYSNNGNTTGSITSLLTGRSPLATGVVYPPDALGSDDARLSLPYLLGDLGYRRENWAVDYYADSTSQNLVGAFDVDNGAQTSGRIIDHFPLGTGVGRWLWDTNARTTTSMLKDVFGLDAMYNPFASVSRLAGDSISDDQRLAAVEDLIAGDQPFFANVHFMTSHGPYFTVESPHFSPGEQTSAWESDSYDDSIRQFDYYLRRIYSELQSTGKLDSTILVITSDHGQEYDAAQRIPVLIRFPGARPHGEYTRNVQRMDLAPTILDYLGYEEPEWMEGETLLELDSVDPEREILAVAVETRLGTGQLVRSGENDLKVTAIRCDTFATTHADGKVETGTVNGSTSLCKARATAPATPN